MAKQLRYASSSSVLSPDRTFFVTTKSSMGRRLLPGAPLIPDFGMSGSYKIHLFPYLIYCEHCRPHTFERRECVGHPGLEPRETPGHPAKSDLEARINDILNGYTSSNVRSC